MIRKHGEIIPGKKMLVNLHIEMPLYIVGNTDRE